MKWTTEAKVGLFTLIGLALFGFIILYLSHVTLFGSSQMEVVGAFKNVTGLKTGNTVRYSGVPVGKVKAISVSPQGVKVKMEIKKDTEIPKDSAFTIQTDGILGEKFVSITPGLSTTYLTDGTTITGVSKNDVDKAVDNMNKVMVQAEKLLKTINTVVGDQQTQANYKTTLENASLITSNLAQTTAQMNALLANNTANINAIAANLNTLSHNMDNVTRQLDATLKHVDGDGKSSENLKAILANLQVTTENLARLSSSLDKVASDQQVIGDLKQTIHNTAVLTSRLSGEGSKTSNKKSRSLFDISAGGYMDTLYNGKAETFDSNMQAHLRVGDNLFVGGANHIGNRTTLDANYGKVTPGGFALRAGIFDGDMGGAVDVGFGKPFHISLAVMNPNDWRYRLRAEARLAKEISAVALFNRPYDSPHGGDYYGLQYNF